MDLSDDKLKELLDQRMSVRQISKNFNIDRDKLIKRTKSLGLKSKFYNIEYNKISENEAICSNCNKIFPINHFSSIGKNNRSFSSDKCMACRKLALYLKANSDIKLFLHDSFTRLKTRAKSEKIFLSISEDEFIAQYMIQDGKCFYSDKEMICEKGKGLSRDALSVDKIIPNLGYIKGNVVFSSLRINACKSNLSLSEMMIWCPLFYERAKNFLDLNKINYMDFI